MNPLDEKSLSRLRKSIEWSRKKLAPFRENRLKFVKQFVGKHYSEDGADDKVPVNYLLQAVLIYSQLLAAAAPRALVRPKSPLLKAAGLELELALNQYIEDVRLKDTVRRMVVDAMFGMGILKTGLHLGATVDLFGMKVAKPLPFVDSISLDDWFHDAQAEVFEQVEYCGNRYKLRVDEIRENEMYDPEVRKSVKPSRARVDSETAARDLSQGEDSSVEEFHEHVWVQDVWLPAEGLVVTMLCNSSDSETGSERPLSIIEWEGPDNGPYRLCQFHTVPSNIMPVSPLATMYDLHDTSNRLWNKLVRQAEREKKVGFIRGGEDEFGNRVIQAKDGEVYRSDDPSSYVEVNMGGIDQQNLAFFLNAKNLISWFGGNLESLGGLAPSADTLGQDQLLASSSSRRVQLMQDVVYDLMRDVVYDLAQYLWDDDLVNMNLQQQIEGTGIAIDFTFSHESKEGRFVDYNFEIEPYSMQRISPQSQAQAVNQIMQTLMPMVPLMQQQGKTINVEGYMRTMSKFYNVRELEDMIIGLEQPPQMPISTQESPTAKPAQTNRTYTRVNKGGVTTQGKEMAMMAGMLGQKVQPKEQELAGR